MPWKMDADGKITIENGNPVLAHSDGKEVPVDGDQLFAKISELNTESAGRRRQLREAEGKLQAFGGIDDIDDFVSRANKALEVVKNLDDKKLIDAGEVEHVKAEAAKSFQAKLDEANTERDAAIAEKNNHILGGSFAGSKFIEERVAPAAKSLLAAKFSPFFAVKNGQTIASDAKGNEIFSRVEPGELAKFDEALEILIDADPYRDDILRSETKAGAGSEPGAPGGSEQKSIPRTQFETLGASEKMKFVKDGGSVTD